MTGLKLPQVTPHWNTFLSTISELPLTRQYGLTYLVNYWTMSNSQQYHYLQTLKILVSSSTPSKCAVIIIIDYSRNQHKISRKQDLQKQIEELGFHPEENNKPSNEQLRKNQLAYNQTLALMATKMKWTSQQIQLTKRDFQIFWAEKWT